MKKIGRDLIVFLLLFLFFKPALASIYDRFIDFFFLAFLIAIIFQDTAIIDITHKEGKRALAFWGVFLGSMMLSYTKGVLTGMNYQIRDFFELYRPVASICFLLTGLRLPEDYKNKFAKILFVVIVVEVGFAMLQRYDVANITQSFLSKIYNMEKSSPYTTKRVVGTYADPNAFGFMLNLCFFYIFLYFKEKKNVFKIILALAHFLVIIVSSSRTSLLTLFIVYFLLVFISGVNKTKIVIGLSFFVGATGLLIFLNFDRLLFLLNNFVYIKNFVIDLQKGGVLNIRTIALRLNYYKILLDPIKNNLILGIGPLKELFSVGDNDYLFTVLRWGVLGACIKYSFYIIQAHYLFKFYRKEKDWFVGGTLVAILMLFIYGLTVESFYHFFFIPVTLVNCGYCLSYIKRFKETQKLIQNSL